MNEASALKAADLIINKRQVKDAIEKLQVVKIGESGIVIRNVLISMRNSVLEEILEKELNYINRMLRSHGVTELD